MTALADDLAQFVKDIQAANAYLAFARDNHGGKGYAINNPKTGSELQKWMVFRDQLLRGTRPLPPTMATSIGKALVDAGVLYLDATAPPPPAPVGQPLWKGDTASDFAGGWEYGGTFDGTPSLSQRVAETAAGLSISVAPGDQYGGSSGWRTLGRQFDPAKRTIQPGYRSWYVWKQTVAAGFPAGANVWVAPFEMHQTKAPYVSVTGPAPCNLITGNGTISVRVSGGRDGAKVDYINQTFPVDPVSNVFIVGYLSDPTAGAFELCRATHGQIAVLVERDSIGTMFEQTGSYPLWGVYRDQTGAGVTEMMIDGLSEYSDRQDALAWAAHLAG